jgi:hypothetical protein
MLESDASRAADCFAAESAEVSPGGGGTELRFSKTDLTRSVACWPESGSADTGGGKAISVPALPDEDCVLGGSTLACDVTVFWACGFFGGDAVV